MHATGEEPVLRRGALPSHRTLHPPFPGTALSGGKGLNRASNVTTTRFPSITRPPSGETLCLGCSYSVTEPCACLSSSDLLRSTTQSERGKRTCPGQRHRGIALPRDDGPCPGQRAPDLGMQWPRGWRLGEGFARSVPGSRPEAGLGWQGWRGAVHLPGTVVCVPGATRLEVAFAFVGVLKNNPLACQGYKQRENKLLSELIKLLSVAAHAALAVRLGRAGVWRVNLHSAVPVLIRP